MFAADIVSSLEPDISTAFMKTIFLMCLFKKRKVAGVDPRQDHLPAEVASLGHH